MEITKRDALLLSNIIFAYMSSANHSYDIEEQTEEFVKRLTTFLDADDDTEVADDDVEDDDDDTDGCPNCGHGGEDDEEECSCEAEGDEDDVAAPCDCGEPDCEECEGAAAAVDAVEDDVEHTGKVKRTSLHDLPAIKATNDAGNPVTLEFEEVEDGLDVLVEGDNSRVFLTNVKYICRDAKAINVFNDGWITFSVNKFTPQWTKLLGLGKTLLITE